MKARIALYCSICFIFGFITGCYAVKYYCAESCDMKVGIVTPTASPSKTIEPSPSPSENPKDQKTDLSFSDTEMREWCKMVHRVKATVDDTTGTHEIPENKEVERMDFVFKPDLNSDGSINYYGYSKEDFTYLTECIAIEARGESWKHQLYVGSVVLNRVEHSSFPNTIKGVCLDVNCGNVQYPSFHSGNLPVPTEMNKAAAYTLLKYGSILPYNVIFQANFKQGGTYEKIDNTYFDFPLQ